MTSSPNPDQWQLASNRTAQAFTPCVCAVRIRDDSWSGLGCGPVWPTGEGNGPLFSSAMSRVNVACPAPRQFQLAWSTSAEATDRFQRGDEDE